MNTKKIISFILAFALLLSSLAALAACEPEDPTDTSDIGTLDVAWAKDLDFGGVTLNVHQSINNWTPVIDGAAIDSPAKFTMATKPNATDNVLNACYERNVAVAKTLNLNINFIETDKNYAGVLDWLRSCIMQQVAMDFIVNDVYSVVNAATEGLLMNVKTTSLAGNPVNNYLNLEHDSWYEDYINGLTVDKNKIYAVAGDYFMSVIRVAHCLYVNTDIFEDKCGDVYPEMDTFYKDIEDGNFTYDLFNELIIMAWEDAGKQGITDEDDKLGFLTDLGNGCGHFPLIYGSKLTVVDYAKNNATVKPDMSSEIEEIARAIDMIAYKDGTLVSSTTKLAFRDVFTEGKAMFVGTYFLGDLEYSSFQAMDNKAAIVYPKINENYEYSTYAHDSAEIGYIPATCTNFEAVTAYVQLLNEQSTGIVTSYFENQLKFKYNTAESSAALDMLDLIRDTLGSPEYQLIEMAIAELGNATAAYSCISKAVKEHNPTNAATQYQANLPAYETGLNALKQKFAQIP